MADDASSMPSESSRLLRIKKRSSAKRFFGVSAIIVILLLAGWFTTKLALSGWNVSGDSIWKNLFSLTGTQLVGEESGRVNVLLLGIPGSGPGVEGPDLTDTVMVASLSTSNQTGFLFSLPRDLYVKIPGYGNSKLNAVYEIGNSQDTTPGTTVQEVVGEVLGLDIPYYVRVDFSGFAKLVDDLGGVTVEVAKDLYDDQYPTADKGYEIVDIKAGTYTMDGEMALKYARSRHSTSDFDRAKRQQDLILAIRSKAMELDLLTQSTKVLAMVDTLQDSFETNMNLGEIKRALELVKGFDSAQLTTKVFDDSATGLLYGTRVDEVYVLRPVGDDFKTVSDYVAQVVSGSATVEELEGEVATEPLKVEVLNGTNTTGLAGKIAGELKTSGYDVVQVGNNTTKGFVKTIVYDLTGGERIWEVRRLASTLQAEIGEDEITTTSGAQARVVLGSDSAS